MIDIADIAHRLLSGQSATLSLDGFRHPVCLTPGSSFADGEAVIYVYAPRRLTFRVTGFQRVHAIALATCLYRAQECRALAQSLNLLLEAMLGTLPAYRESRGLNAAPSRIVARAAALLETTP